MLDQKSGSAPIGITMGCPASIGPELIVKFHLARPRSELFPLVIIGDIEVLEKICSHLDLTIDIRTWKPGMKLVDTSLNVYPASNIKQDSFAFGSPTPETSIAMASYVEKAIELCMAGELRAIVTCPISKLSLSQAGYDFPGHTELLAQRTGTQDVAMMLTGDSLRVVPATIHCSLAQVVQSLSSETIARQIILTERALKSDFNLEPVRIGVAGLNPHAGENGLFGKEEQTIILPAIEEARKNCDPSSIITGPYPPDTIFYKARGGAFDAVVAMYHDQGLIPFKLLHFEDGVNVTLGLPIVRTSVDHGTAYDIAGQGITNIDSLTSAVRLAHVMAANRQRKLPT